MFRRSRSPRASLPHRDPLDPNYGFRRSKSDAREPRFSRTRSVRRYHEDLRTADSSRSRRRSRSPLRFRSRATFPQRASDPDYESGRSCSEEDRDYESPPPSSVDVSLEELSDEDVPVRNEIPGRTTQTASLGDQYVTRSEVFPPSNDSGEFAEFTPPAEGACPSQGHQEAGAEHPDRGLDPGLLLALGENPQAPPPPALHTSIVDRWRHHLLYGLPQDAFSALREAYTVPSNLQILQPPKLNPEIAASVSATHKTIDTGYSSLQRQCATAITALGMGLSKVIDQGGEAAVTLGPSYQNMFDAGRAMTALFYDVSCTRRRLIQNVCSSTLSMISHDVPPSEWLFGDDLGARFAAHLGMEENAKGLISLKRPPPNPPKRQQPQKSVSLQDKGAGNRRGRAGRRAHDQAKPHALQHTSQQRFDKGQQSASRTQQAFQKSQGSFRPKNSRGAASHQQHY